MSKESCPVLLVEDNEDHVVMTIEALCSGGVKAQVNVATDGEAALDYLYARDGFKDRNKYPLPKLVLLDIKMPKLDGMEVLKKIKSDPDLRAIPVVMLTTSENQEDIDEAYACGANSYVVKSFNFDIFFQKVEGLQRYWLGLTTFPN